MELEQLSRLIQLPETHRQILSGYRGAYSLGIGHEPNFGDEPVLVLHVEPGAPTMFPSSVHFGPDTVPLVVHTGFVRPRPLPLRVPSTY